MAGKESLQQAKGGIVEGYKKLNETTRNIAVGVAVVAAVVGAEAVIIPALLWAGSDQVQIKMTEKYQNWRAKGGTVFDVFKHRKHSAH